MGTVSEYFRQAGNALFRQCNEGLAPILMTKRLEDALGNYEKALVHATTNADMAKCHKNIAATKNKLANVLNARKMQPTVVWKLFESSLNNFHRSYEFAKLAATGIFSGEWFNRLEISSSICWHEYAEEIDSDSKLLEQSKWIVSRTLRYKVLIDQFEFYFHRGITFWQEEQHIMAVQSFMECNFPLEEARKIAAKEEADRINCLKEDVIMQMGICESQQMMDMGNSSFKYEINEAEGVDMTAIFQALDQYKQAAILARGFDIELEAEANSRIGMCYDQVLHIQSRAREYHTTALHLAHSTSPRNLSNKSWFKESSKYIKNRQEKIKQQEELQESKVKDKIKEKPEIKASLQEINKKFSPVNGNRKLDFLEFIYNTYKPTHIKSFTGFTKPTEALSNKANKKLISNAILHYHPDRITDDMDKKVIFEEITKLLSSHYENCKAMCE